MKRDLSGQEVRLLEEETITTPLMNEEKLYVAQDQYEDARSTEYHLSGKTGRREKRNLLLSFVAVFSLSINVFLIFILTSSSSFSNRRAREYAKGIVGLLPDSVDQIVTTYNVYSHMEDQGEQNDTLRDQVWANIQWNRGLVVVDQQSRDQLNLESSRVFPWDTSKQVYHLNVFHQLHCLQGLYQHLSNVNRGGQLGEYDHLVHCLDALRQDVMCAADDELLYFNLDEGIGHHHPRKCRDFDKLDAWALDNNACTTPGKPEPPYYWDQLFANCPKDSPYYMNMVKILGKPEGWEPPLPPSSGPAMPV